MLLFNYSVRSQHLLTRSFGGIIARVLVTGASGFIGVPLLRLLVLKGNEVLALSRKDRPSQISSSIKWLIADLTSPKSYKHTIEDFEPEVLIHLAWQEIPDYSLATSSKNLNMSLDLLAFIIGLHSCKKIVVSGSCWEYNITNGLCLETTIGFAKDHFTWAKHALFSWLNMMCKQKDIQISWMRIFYVYGPRQRAESLITNILTKLKNFQLPELHTPKNANDFVFIDDVVAAFSKLISTDNKSGVYNLGSGVSIPILEVCRLAEQIVLGSEELTQEMEAKFEDTTCDIDFWADCSKAKKHLGWQPKISIEKGINQTWEWLKAQ